MNGRALTAFVLSGLVVTGTATAEAAWQKTGPGTAAARADSLPAPAGFKLTGSNCNNGKPKASVSWTNPAPGLWTGLDVVAAPAADSTAYTVLTTSQGTSADLDLPYRPAYLSVRTVRNSWRGRSDVVRAC
ncbi:hypothetical protein [Amycolatopsis sp. NPDC004378]